MDLYFRRNLIFLHVADNNIRLISNWIQQSLLLYFKKYNVDNLLSPVSSFIISHSGVTFNCSLKIDRVEICADYKRKFRWN